MLQSITRMEIIMDVMRDNLHTIKQGKGWKDSAARARKLSLKLAKEMKEFRKLSVEAAREAHREQN